jgi:nucleoside-diphosphate-sugar epimerase
MKVVIAGGCGFIGLRLAQRLLARGTLTGPSGAAEQIDELVLFDMEAPPDLPDALADERVTVLLGEISNRDEIFHLVDRDDIAVFHLASVVSGGGEQDFDLALRVNLDGGLNVMEACRARAWSSPPRSPCSARRPWARWSATASSRPRRPPTA